MFNAAAKAFFHALAGSPRLKRLASRYGLRQSAGPARRFVAGETLDEAIAAARRIEALGLLPTLDYLGEGITRLDEAREVVRQHLDMLDRLALAGISRYVSVKLTQLGLDVDRAVCLDHLRQLLDRARARDCFVRVDMEGSAYTAATLDIVERLWHEGHRGVGVVLQACLRRSESDLARINALGMRVRLVKGAYSEPDAVAWRKKVEVDRAFSRLMDTLLRLGTYPAIATHDATLIDEAKRRAAELGVPRDAFEFQMLYGIRRDLQTALAKEGYRVRIYIPFGREWFPYFMRRLGERPANVLFVVKGLWMERNG